jgi:hypothetical protein
MNINGECQCGKITFEALADPDNAYICNRTDCQTLTGSAIRWSVTVPESDFKLLTGNPRTFVKVLDDGSTRSMRIISSGHIDGQPRWL